MRTPPWVRAWRRIGDDAARDPHACWIWPGAVTNGGYARIGEGLVHRILYEAMIGPIPAGLDLDHLCRIRRCVNPSHLEPVTRGENLMRGDHPTAVVFRSNVCKRGHDLTLPGAVRRPQGTRRCLACERLRDRARAPRRRVAARG